MNDHTQDNLTAHEEVAQIEGALNRLAAADQVTPTGMTTRVAAAAVVAARAESEVTVAGRIAPDSGRRKVAARQWSIAAMLLIGCGIGFALLSSRGQSSSTSPNVASAEIVAEDMESWLTLASSTDETFSDAVKNLTLDTTKVSESVASPSTLNLDGDSL